MKKLKTGLLAGLLATACAGAAAQSSVQVMGLLDGFVGGIRMAGDPGRTRVVDNGGLTTSWWGMKGSEDLGGGVKANFLLTSFLRVDSGAAGRFTGDPYFSRDSSVGLSGEFGSFNLGRGLAPNFLPTILFNPFGDSFTFSPLVLHANVPLFNGTNWQPTTPSDTGWSNEFVYTSPSFGGLTANLHYQLGEVARNTGSRNIGFNLLYFRGPFAATAFYERDQISNPIAPAPFATGDKKTDWMLGASYDFTAVKAYATYGKAKSNTLIPQAKTLSLGASVPVGGGKVLIDTARTRVTPGGSTRRTTTVGYDYDLSKRTDVYAMLMRDAITSFNSGTSWGVGVRHRF